MQRLIPRDRGPLRLLAEIGLDIAIVALGYTLALLLRFDNDVPQVSRDTARQVVPLIAAGYVVVFFLFGIYRTVWRYGSISDVLNLAKAVALVTVVVFVFNRTREVRDIPLSVNLIAGALVFILSAFVKLSPRLLSRRRTQSSGRERRLLIAGAGSTGQFVAREFRAHPEWLHRPVAFIDDDRRKHGLRVHGVPVAGGADDLRELIRRYRVDVVALAFPTAPGAKVRELVTICQDAGVSVRMVQGLPEMVRAGAAMPGLRDLTVEDLIGREPVEIDYSECRESLHDKTVLITGAAGSIGSELARQVAGFGPRALHLLDNNETALHDLRHELDAREGELDLRTWLTDVADADKLRRVFETVRPHVVFHAAAYKHVPIMEEHPDEALRVNVQGTLNLCRAADQTGVEKVVAISTDKAINPTSVMGASKRIGELVMLAFGAHSRTTFCAVRFVNVIGSRGSVVDIFGRQIEQGGPVRVTDPNMRRYYITITEAVSLVIQAGAFADQSQIFMLDIGEEIRTGDLAEKMIRMRGLTPNVDVPIVVTGPRPGEKLREDLLAPDEQRFPTHHPKVLRIESSVHPSLALLEAEIAALRAGSKERDVIAARIHAIARDGGAALPGEGRQSRAPEHTAPDPPV